MNSLHSIQRSLLKAKANNQLTFNQWRIIKPQNEMILELVNSKGEREKVKIIGGLAEERILVPIGYKKPSELLIKIEKFDFIIKSLKAIGILSFFK